LFDVMRKTDFRGHNNFSGHNTAVLTALSVVGRGGGVRGGATANTKLLCPPNSFSHGVLDSAAGATASGGITVPSSGAVMRMARTLPASSTANPTP
jgi:hypothetical protein